MDVPVELLLLPSPAYISLLYMFRPFLKKH